MNTTKKEAPRTRYRYSGPLTCVSIRGERFTLAQGAIVELPSGSYVDSLRARGHLEPMPAEPAPAAPAEPTKPATPAAKARAATDPNHDEKG